MKKKNKVVYTEAPPEIEEALDSAIKVKDFLPSPEELLKSDKKSIKVTLALTSRSLELFKKYAGKHGGKYQTMLRRLIDSYAERTLAGKV
ncbi:CopG family transcriptional regulator [Fibrobacterota bacterium]